MSIKIGICGGNGMMGKALEAAISKDNVKYILSGTLTSASDISDIKHLCKISDVIIDFSSPKALSLLLSGARENKTKLIIGTTGFCDEHFAMMEEAGNEIPVLYAPNTSIGANLVALLSAKAAVALSNYDIEIVEAHHKHKQDAPSGAALMIGRQIAAAIDCKLEEKAIFGRHLKGKRLSGEIGFSSIRGGGIYGEHTVIFAGENEVIKIQHQALNRDVFAAGALNAVNWIVNKIPGVYTMIDMLEIE